MLHQYIFTSTYHLSLASQIADDFNITKKKAPTHLKLNRGSTNRH